MLCKDGYSAKLVIQLVKVNGTVKHIPRIRYTKCPEDVGPTVAIAFLSLLFIIAFLLNLMVIVTVTSSYTMKRLLHCRLMLNLCMTCLLDCLCNMSIAIAYINTAPWQMGHLLCYFNSFAINLLSNEMAFAILFLCVDRLAAVKKFSFYLTLSRLKFGLLVATTWVLSFLMASPLVCGFVYSLPYRSRYSCTVADPQDDLFLVIHLVVVLAVPTIFVVVLTAVTAFTFHKDRRKQRPIKGNRTIRYLDQILMTPVLRTEFYPALVSGIIVVFYVLFWLPFTALTTIDPMTTTHWVNKTLEDMKVDLKSNEMEQLVRSAIMEDNSTNPMTNTTERMENFIPEIESSPAYETVFIWFRFVFDAAVPVVVFSVLKDLRKKCEVLILCCRPNSVDIASPRPISAPYKKRKQDAAGSKENKSSKNMVSYKTPVLFATSEGLHIRTIEETYRDMIENKPLLDLNKNEPQFRYGLCDVMLGLEDLADFTASYHIDDQYDFEGEKPQKNLGAGHSLVSGAERVARGQKSQVPQNVEDDEMDVVPEPRPPTPPKVEVIRSDPLHNFGDTIELDKEEKKPRKGRKAVSFAPDIRQEIPRPESPETSSLLESSTGSLRSTDSGIMADTEQQIPPRRLTLGNKSPLNVRKTLAKNRLGKPPTVPVPIRGPLRPPVRPTVRNSASKNGTAKKSVYNKRIKKIKSRHLAVLDGSMGSLEDEAEDAGTTNSLAPPRRFSSRRSSNS